MAAADEMVAARDETAATADKTVAAADEMVAEERRASKRRRVDAATAARHAAEDEEKTPCEGVFRVTDPDPLSVEAEPMPAVDEKAESAGGVSRCRTQ